MKRKNLIKRREEMGFVLVKHGKRHDWNTNLNTKQSQPVPPHTEINEYLAKSIIKKLSNE
ncbi:MAG: type II toxin-antitoxin system HicA family toxin [candidate division KSB1 bacterium]|nr:type II toxin-antitoxin system HicA family toxin [candidate division KSB1 bacterium]MDZ7401500.1 type II toxin-antitoxin system HicA family toxin [candidate division KSB1 bacterium]